MKLRVFVDTNVFIYAFEYPSSNSARIIDLLNQEKIDVVISSRVVKEVSHYFEKFHTRKLAETFRKYLLESCIVISEERVTDVMDLFRGKIKEKDLEQLAVTKALGIKYLISYDRDFEPFTEYITPKKFVVMVKIKVAVTEF